MMKPCTGSALNSNGCYFVVLGQKKAITVNWMELGQYRACLPLYIEKRRLGQVTPIPKRQADKER